MAAGAKCVKAVRRLAAIMEDPTTAPADAIRAASLLLAYGVGRPDVIRADGGPPDKGALGEMLFRAAVAIRNGESDLSE